MLGFHELNVRSRKGLVEFVKIQLFLDSFNEVFKKVFFCFLTETFVSWSMLEHHWHTINHKRTVEFIGDQGPWVLSDILPI